MSTACHDEGSAHYSHSATQVDGDFHSQLTGQNY